MKGATRLLLGASVAIPAGLFGFLAWQSRQDVEDAAYRRVSQTTAILHEHALKVLEINATALHRAAEYLLGNVGGDPGSAAAFHQYLVRVKESTPSILSLWVFAPDGSAIATSDDLTLPRGPIVPDRDYFVYHKQTAGPAPFVSRPLIGRANRQAQFALTRRLEDTNGRFAGVASSGIYTNYFIQNWKDIAPELASSAALVREDGVILARNPPVAVDAPPVRADSPVMRAMRAGTSDVIPTVSPVDGELRIVGFRKLAGYPVFITYSVAMSAVLAQWHRTLALYGVLCGSAALALVAMTLLVNRRIKGEERALARAQTEAATRKATQDELALANADLQRLLAQLRANDESRTRFFANVSHELRTPLTLILGPVGRLLKRERLDSEAHQQLEVVERSARMLQRHVNDLLDIAKLEAGSMLMRYVRTDLAQLVRLVASNFESPMADRGIRYEVDSPPHLPAEVDPEKVERMLLNLLSNANKFTPEGGTVRLSLEARGERVLIRVQDNGPGVPESMRDAVFERFRQVEDSMERVHGGTGLGLAIVREFAQLHEGTVQLADAPGGGALFTVDLPLKAPANAQVSDAAAAGQREIQPRLVEVPHERQPAPPGRPVDPDAARVLVVEDHPDMNAFIADALGRYYWVSRAFDGKEGLDKALADPPDLIIADVMMPGMSGSRMVEELRRHSVLDDVPIVMLTAKADNTLRMQLLRNGVQDYLHKPFTVEVLLARVDGLLTDRRRTERRLRLSEDRYRTLFNSIDEGFCIIEVIFDDHGKAVDYRFLEVNPAFEKQTGLPGVQGKRMRELAPQHEQHWFETYGNVVRTGVPVRFENRAEQLQRWFDVYAFRYGDPELRQVAVLFNDVTARKQAELSLIEADRRKNQFLAFLAHELRNPLAPVRNAVLVLQMSGAGLHSAAEQLLPVMERQLAHMARLLDDLLDVSRITRGNIEVRKERTDFRAAVQTAIEANRPLIDGMAHALTVSVPDKPLWLDGDPVRLTQIVSNLLNNAANYSAPGGSIELKVEMEAGWIVVRVRDKGVGIREQDLTAIFGLFVQVGDPYARQQGGLGIGLSLVRALAAMHGGTVQAHSEGLGFGSEFVVRLPAAEGPEKVGGRRQLQAGTA